MKKSEIKDILFSMRTNENEAIINKILGKIDMMDENSIQTAIQEVGDSREAVMSYLQNKVEKHSQNTDEHKPINKMFSYGITGDCVHLHLPVDLHQMISKQGPLRTVDTVNLYLLDAIERVTSLKKEGFHEFKNIDNIFMISPILRGRELKFLDGLDFKTAVYRSKQLNDEEFLTENPEANLAIKIFGKEQSVGTAKIKLDTVLSSEWQEKKKRVEDAIKAKGITLEEPGTEK